MLKRLGCEEKTIHKKEPNKKQILDLKYCWAFSIINPREVMSLKPPDSDINIILLCLSLRNVETGIKIR